MIGDREQVYENIRTAVSLNQLNSKVEPGDPKLLREDKEALLKYMNRTQLEKAIERTRKQMTEAAKKLDFIEAAQFRDELVKLEDLLKTKKD